jgi:hypothetical protein
MNELMNVRQVHEFMGGNIGRDTIIKLMKSNVIPSVWLKNRLVARRRDVERFLDNMFKKPLQNDIISIIPTGDYNESNIHNTVR